MGRAELQGSAILGLPMGTVKTHLYRARERLKSYHAEAL